MRHGFGGTLVRAMLAASLAWLPMSPATAQNTPGAVPRLAIVVLDRDALYAGSLFGQRIRREIEAASQALSRENRRIEAALVAEEQVLTDQRAQMGPAAFRAMADEFDTRVEEIRQAQDVKGRALAQQAEQASQLFFEFAGPVLTELAQRTGALVVLDRRTVLAAADQVDITTRAIAEVDRTVGAGPGLEAMMDAQVQVPTQRPEGLSRPPIPDAPAPTAGTNDNTVESPGGID
jgi:Skp family chaperone for outer membrane proteins